MEDGPPSPAKKKAKSPANGRTQRRKSVSKKEEPGSGGKRGKRGTNQAAVPAVVGPLTETHIFLDVRSETGGALAWPCMCVDAAKYTGARISPSPRSVFPF